MPVTSRRSRRFFLVAGLSCALAADAPDGSGQEAGAARARRHSSPARGRGAASGSAPSTPSATTPTRAGRPPPASTSRFSSTAAPPATYLPWLATAHKWGAGNLTVRFAIRPGRPLVRRRRRSPPDVVFTFDLMRRFSGARPPGVWGFLADVKAADASSVEFTFKRAYTPGLLAIGTQPIVAEHRWKDVAQPAAFDDPEPGGHRPLHGGAALRAHRLRAGPEPEVLADRTSPTVAALRVPLYRSNDGDAARPGGRRAGLGFALPGRRREAMGGQGPDAPPLLVPGPRADGAAAAQHPATSPSTTPRCARPSAWPSTGRASCARR